MMLNIWTENSLAINKQHCLSTRKHGKVLDSDPVGLPLRYFWYLIKQMPLFLTQTILRWSCFWMLRAKQKGALAPWGVRNYSHIRYYLHNELRSQFIHFHYANLLHIMGKDCVYRSKPHFCRCYMNKSWDSPCSCRLQCSVTVTWKQRIKGMYNEEKVQIDVSSKKAYSSQWGKSCFSSEKLYGLKVHMGYADIPFIFKGGCSAYETRQINRLRHFSPLHLENKCIWWPCSSTVTCQA